MDGIKSFVAPMPPFFQGFKLFPQRGLAFLCGNVKVTIRLNRID